MSGRTATHERVERAPSDVAPVDVAIVGAGPAGSSLALRLGAAGLRVLLVDALAFPRPKPCGDFVDPAAVALLAELGVLGELLADGAQPVRGLRLFAAGRVVEGRYTARRSGEELPFGLGLSRERLDELLLRAALRSGNVDFLEGWRARELARAPDGSVRGVVLRRAGAQRLALARVVVGADGPHSAVASALGEKARAPRVERLAFVAPFSSAEREAGGHGLADVHLLRDGFVGVAPLAGGSVSVGLVVERLSFERSGLAPRPFFERRLASIAPLARALERAEQLAPVRGRGPLALRRARRVFDGAALVGDAAEALDPLTGEGVYHALRDAALLAEVLERALLRGRVDRAALAPYERRARLELAPRRALSRALLAGLRRPALVGAAFALLDGRPRLAGRLVDLLGRAFPRAGAPRAAAAERLVGSRA